MSICEASGVEVVDKAVEDGGVGSDNMSDSEDEVFRLRSDSDPSRKPSTSLLCASVRSSAVELALRGKDSVCLNIREDGDMR